MKNDWLGKIQQGLKKKWLLSLFYCALLSISFLMDTFSPATKHMFCQDFASPKEARERQAATETEETTNTHKQPTAEAK